MKKEMERSMQMFHTMDRMRRAWMSITPKPEISKSQFRTLMMLRHGNIKSANENKSDPFAPMTLSNLSAKMGHSMPAVCQQISKLESMGYVERFPDEKDRRTVWIRLTESGYELLKTSYHSMVQKLNFIMEQLGEEDTQTMFHVLNKLTDIMESTIDDNRKGNNL